MDYGLFFKVRRPVILYIYYIIIEDKSEKSNTFFDFYSFSPSFVV